MACSRSGTADADLVCEAPRGPSHQRARGRAARVRPGARGDGDPARARPGRHVPRLLRPAHVRRGQGLSPRAPGGAAAKVLDGELPAQRGPRDAQGRPRRRRGLPRQDRGGQRRGARRGGHVPHVPRRPRPRSRRRRRRRRRRHAVGTERSPRPGTPAAASWGRSPTARATPQPGPPWRTSRARGHSAHGHPRRAGPGPDSVLAYWAARPGADVPHAPEAYGDFGNSGIVRCHRGTCEFAIDLPSMYTADGRVYRPPSPSDWREGRWSTAARTLGSTPPT